MYAKYAKAVCRHKWFVLLECIEMARATGTPGLAWRGLTHDLSKFRPKEFIPYAQFFYGKNRDNSKYHAPAEEGDAKFNEAWLAHQNLNSHHWQWWVLLFDDGGTEPLPMDRLDRMEMLCDWIGAGKAYGNGGTTQEWYLANKDNMILHPTTRLWLECKLKVTGWRDK